MKTKCIGWGAIIQNINENEPGFTPKEEISENTICKRCFELKHYGKIINYDISNDEYEKILLEIKKEEAIPPPKDLQTALEAVSKDKTPNEINEDSPTLLEEAYDAYQDALLAWQKGDFETALAALDETYSLIIRLKLPQDSPLLQEKNDIRLLIAKRIQEI